MNDEPQQTRSTLASAAETIGWVLFVATAALAFSLRHSLHSEKAVLKSVRAELELERIAQESAKESLTCAQVELKWQLDEHESEKKVRESKWVSLLIAEADLAWQLEKQTLRLQQSNEKNDQLAVVVAKHDSEMPAHPLLWQRTEQEGRRFIGRDGIARLRAMLKNAPAFDVEIGYIKGDADALAIAEELRVAFGESGSKVRELVQYPAPPIKLRGVSIHSKPKFDDALGDIIGQIFREVSQEKNQWVGNDEIVPLKSGGREPDIMIFVGEK